MTYSPQGYAAMRARIKREKTCMSHVGVPVIEGQTKCAKCVKRRKHLYRRKIKAGVCYVHPQTPALPGKKCCQVCVEVSAIKYAALKFEVLTHYCGGNPYCQCSGCKISFIGFLQIDHVNGDGHKHLSDNGRRLKGPELLGWLKRNNYPEGFQVLCSNCNQSKNRNKTCALFGQNHTS